VCFSNPLCSLAFALFTWWTLESILCWFDSLILFGQILVFHTFVRLLGLLDALSKLYLLLALESISMHSYLIHIIWHALISLIQYIGWTLINPKSAKMCMKFKVISICTYLCGACPIYCSVSNYFGPNEFGNHIVLEYVLGTWEIYWCLSQ
jgi:hypothetical protein